MLQEGLLWFDDDPKRSVLDKIARAVQRYQQKYGHSPDVCYANPADLKDGDAKASGVRVLPAKTVLPHHFWIAVEPSEKKRK